MALTTDSTTVFCADVHRNRNVWKVSSYQDSGSQKSLKNPSINPTLKNSWVYHHMFQHACIKTSWNSLFHELFNDCICNLERNARTTLQMPNRRCVLERVLPQRPKEIYSLKYDYKRTSSQQIMTFLWSWFSSIIKDNYDKLPKFLLGLKILYFVLKNLRIMFLQLTFN